MQAIRLDVSPKGDTVEDDEQSETPGSERTVKHLLDGHHGLQIKHINNLK